MNDVKYKTNDTIGKRKKKKRKRRNETRIGKEYVRVINRCQKK